MKLVSLAFETSFATQRRHYHFSTRFDTLSSRFQYTRIFLSAQTLAAFKPMPGRTYLNMNSTKSYRDTMTYIAPCCRKYSIPPSASLLKLQYQPTGTGVSIVLTFKRSSTGCRQEYYRETATTCALLQVHHQLCTRVPMFSPSITFFRLPTTSMLKT